MITSLANVSLLVRDYDEAIQWYTKNLGLELRMDGSMGGDCREYAKGVGDGQPFPTIGNSQTGDRTNRF